MQELVFSDFEIPTNDVLHKGKDLVLCHFALLLEQRAEITLLTVFGDDVAVCGLADYIEAFEDVGVLEFGQGLDLAI